MRAFFLAEAPVRLRWFHRRSGVGRTFLLAILLLSGLTGGCQHGELRNGVFTKSSVRYRIGDLPAGWKWVSLRDNDNAWVLNGTEQSIAVNSTCEDYQDAPLPVLTQHLLMGFTDRQLIRQETAMLDGREALRSHYRAKLDGVPVELLLVVVKKNGCIYDFTYLSPVGRFEEKLPDFERLLQGFKAEAP
jgi:hypothetical protein